MTVVTCEVVSLVIIFPVAADADAAAAAEA